MGKCECRTICPDRLRAVGVLVLRVHTGYVGECMCRRFCTRLGVCVCVCVCV